MVDFDDEVYRGLLKYLRNSNSSLKNLSSKEDTFVRRLSKQVEGFDKGGISLDILFTEINLTNLSVKIFATLEDVIPKKINHAQDDLQRLQQSNGVRL